MMKKMILSTNRRSFLVGATLAAASAPFASRGKVVVEDPAKMAEVKLHIGEPVLQVPSDTSMGVVWSVNKLCNGFVELADNPNFTHARRVMCGGMGGLAAFDDCALQVRLTDLKPATRYWYRTITVEMLSFANGYQVKLAPEVKGKVYSFTTLGAKAQPHFCVINDTHAQFEQFALLTEKVRALKPACLVWNGDATNSTETAETARDIFLTPPQTRADYAAEIPILFNEGNHEKRGRWARHFETMMMPRLPSERDAKYWALTRNYAVRLGDIAVIGLDTGEDKPDAHPYWHGTAAYSPFRQLQAAWLKDQFAREEIRAAPFKVVVCHIPLFDARPSADDGTVIDPNKYALWSRECAEAWGPILTANGVQVVIAAHMHAYRYDAPTPTRPWAQLVAGGAAPRGRAKSYPTVLDAQVKKGKLHITVHNVYTQQIVATHSFAPRGV